MDKITKQNILGILYLISKPKDRIFRHRIRLQKFVLLAEKEFGYSFDFEYESYYYGPYSEGLQFLISDLVQSGYIQESANELSNGNFEFFYSLTKAGEKKLEQLFTENKNDLKKLDLLWDKYNDKSTNLIVAAAKQHFSNTVD